MKLRWLEEVFRPSRTQMYGERLKTSEANANSPILEELLDDLRCEGYNLLETSFRDFAWNWTEDAVCTRLLLLLAILFYEHDGVVVERDVRAICATSFVDGSDNHTVHNILLLHHLTRFSCLD